MMGTEDKTLLCFCHWGKTNKVLPDGSTSYVRGTEQIIVKTGIKYNDFVNAVFDGLGIDPSDKILHFTVKFDRSELIRLRDQEGVDALLQFNDGSAHVYASGLEEEPYSRPPSGDAEKAECIVDSDSESDRISDCDRLEMYDYPEPEFSNFDKHRAQLYLAVDKIWACYDKTDGMPRHYALIRKVSGFKIKFTCLVSCPEGQREGTWVSGCLLVGCGRFRCGITAHTYDRFAFSHQVQCIKRQRGHYIVYPRKGETWALFKDVDIHRSSSPKNHRKYKYEVEILFDYFRNVGVEVGYLDKVAGFVSLFQLTRLTVVGTFFIKPNELYKFSHRIPSFKMTGTERDGVPAGSFELDPYALHLNPDDIWYPGEVKEDSRTANSEPVENVVCRSPWN